MCARRARTRGGSHSPGIFRRPVGVPSCGGTNGAGAAGTRHVVGGRSPSHCDDPAALAADDSIAHVDRLRADRWHVGFCERVGCAGLLGQVEGRNAVSVSEWMDKQSKQWRAGVKVVAIDMCTVFKAAITACLPHAILVVDLFHVVRLVNNAVTEVRAASRSGTGAGEAARAIASGSCVTG